MIHRTFLGIATVRKQGARSELAQGRRQLGCDLHKDLSQPQGYRVAEAPWGPFPVEVRDGSGRPCGLCMGSRDRPVGDLSGRDSAGSLQQQDSQPQEGAPWSWSVVWAPYRDGPHCALGQETHLPVVETLLLRELSEIPLALGRHLCWSGDHTLPGDPDPPS